jgi:hypothetical protein
MKSIDYVISQFNKDYPLFEKNIKFLIAKNSTLKYYIYILIFVIAILALALVICAY